MEHTRRRIVTFNWVSADGYFAASDGNMEWVVPDHEQAKAAAASIQNFDTALFGRRTYEIFAAYWPNALTNASGTMQDAHHPARRSREYGTIANALNGMSKLVFSRTLTTAVWKNSRVLREIDPREVKLMKGLSGEDMILFGSGSIVSQLTQYGLIDEYQFVMCPIFLGNGQPLLKGVSSCVRLDLLENKALPSGDVILRYARRVQV